MDQCNTATQVLTTLDTQIYNTGHGTNSGSSWHAVSWASALQTLQFTTMFNKNSSYPLPQKYRFSFLNFRLALKSHSTFRSYTGRPATRLEITVVDTCLPALPVKVSTTTKLWQQEKHLEAQLSTFKHYIKLEPTPAHFLLLLGLSLSFKSSAATTFAH